MLDSGKKDQLILEEVAFDEEEDIYIVLNYLLTSYFLITRWKIVADTTLSGWSYYHQHQGSTYLFNLVC